MTQLDHWKRLAGHVRKQAEEQEARAEKAEAALAEAEQDAAGWKRTAKEYEAVLATRLIEAEQKALLAAAAEYPAMTRDMVSRASVKQWLRDRAMRIS